MKVSIEAEIAEDLIKFKLHSIQSTLAEILKYWKQDNAEDFIDNVKSGVIQDGEMDAITVRQLIKDIDTLNALLKTIR